MPSKPGILLLHGFLGNSSEWQPLAEALKDRWHCVAVDLPGHGDSEPPSESPFGALREEWSAEPSIPGNSWALPSAWTESVDELLRPLHKKWKALIGYSMGGRLALALCAAHPERFDGLVLEAASTGTPDPAERDKRLGADRKLAAELRVGPFRDFLGRWYRQPLFAVGEAEREALVGERLGGDPGKLAAALEWLGSGHQPDYLPLLEKRWKKPLLCIAGALDVKYAALMESTAARVAGARCRVLVGCGHNVHRGLPGPYRAALLDFLGGY